MRKTKPFLTAFDTPGGLFGSALSENNAALTPD
jgi:hypothetical protein